MRIAIPDDVRTFGVAAAALAASMLPTLAWDQALFTRARTLGPYNTTSALTRAGVGDINGDGHADAVYGATDLKGKAGPIQLVWQPIDVSGNSTAVRLGDGGKALQMSDPRVADIDGDGIADVVFAFDHFLVTARGALTIGPRQAFADLRQRVGGVWLGDFDGDKRPDALVRQHSLFAINFSPAEPLPLDPDLPSGLPPGKKLTLAVRPGDGLGGFGTPVPLPLDGTPVIADVNRDGRPDIVVITSTVHAVLNTGGGTFAEPLASAVFFNGTGDAVGGDFTGDGFADVAVATGSVVQILRGDGTGLFEPHAAIDLPIGPGGSPARPESLAAGGRDHEGSGDRRFAHADDVMGPQPVVAARGMAGGAFTVHPVAPDASAALGYVVYGDVNDDGLGDVVGGLEDAPAVLLGVPTLAAFHALTQKLMALHHENTALRGNISAARAELKLVETRLVQVEKQLEQARAANLELQDLNEQLSLANEGLRNQYAALEQRYEDTVAALTAEIDALNARAASLTKQIDQLTAALDAVGKELEASQGREQALKQDVAAAKNQTAAVAHQLAISANQTSSLTRLILGESTDRTAAETLHAHAAALVSYVKAANLPRDRRLADAEDALARSLAAIAAGDYVLARKEAERAHDIARRIATRNGLPINVTPPAPGNTTAPGPATK